jgi:hypothetical protein
LQSERKNMANIGGELHGREDVEARCPPELVQFVFGPKRVVLSEADSVEPACAGELDELLRMKRAALRTGLRVAVEVDQH